MIILLKRYNRYKKLEISIKKKIRLISLYKRFLYKRRVIYKEQIESNLS